MAIREDSKINKALTVASLTTRDDVRNCLLSEWMNEASGQQYRYFVDTFSDGKRLYLERPGRLNKGCDFVIYGEDLLLYKNGNDKPPSFSYLKDDLKYKKEKLNPETWRQLIVSINSVHELTFHEVPTDCENEINQIAPLSLEQIQLLCKWFFIEQDLTYWSGKGRNMLLESINSI